MKRHLASFAAFLLASLVSIAPLASVAEAQTLTRGPLIQNPDALTTTMTILWWTNVAGNSTVEYGTTSGLGSSVTVPQAGSCEVGSAGTCHSVTLTGLTPGTRYYYRLLTNSVQVLGVNYFKTFMAPNDTSELYFTLIGDWGSDTSSQANIANNQNADDTPLLITVGDNAYQNGTQSDWDNNAFIPAYENQILRRAVFIPTLGNHDLNDVGDDNWQDSVEIKMHAKPHNGPSGQAERYFSFDHGDAHFVILDSNPPALNSQQANWLDADLAANTRKWTFVSLHHPPYSCANGLISFGSDFTVRGLFSPILEKHGVDLVFDGHDHLYERTGFVDEYVAGGGSGSDGLGTRYIMTGGGGENLDSAANSDGGGAYRQPLFGSKSYCPWLSNTCPSGVGGQYCSFARFQHAEVRIVNNTTLTLRAIDENDNVFDTLTITKTSSCGDSIVEGGEGCDQGAANGTSSSCCTSDCQPRSAGLTCRPSAGVCDVAETCDGTAGSCPTNAFLPSTSTCRGSTGVCDAPEMCTGTSATCPADVLAGSGTVCRTAVDVCDLAENCDGASASCPADVIASDTTPCRASSGECDVAENCSGASVSCPADGFASSSVQCRASNGICDAAEHCSGFSATCPVDSFAGAGTTCRASVDVCDAAETCTGLSIACPVDGFAAAGTTCRPAFSVCDVAETCTGVSSTCPGDGFAAPGLVCRAANGACDAAESCNGSSSTCPPDLFASNATLCRAVTDVCDVAENCTGSSAICPPNVLKPLGTECRASTGACDTAENCTGSSDACPADVLASSSTLCRASAGVCDVAERCTGSSNACPVDAFQPSTLLCRGSGGVCDVAENCTGSSAACPTNSYVAAGTECRASTDVCDRAELCTGAGTSCPADLLEPSSTVCRPAVELCDKPENCSGLASACPSDLMQPAGIACRAAVDSCDAPEVCDGSLFTCPGDSTLPDGDGDSVCDLVDVCPAVADADQVDSDEDGLGDACDPCTNFLPVYLTRAKLSIARMATPPGDDTFKLSGTMTVPTTPAIDPINNGLRLMLRDAAGNVVLDAEVPAGAYNATTREGWKAAGTGFSYANTGTAVPLVGGIYKLSLKIGSGGVVKVTAAGKQGSFSLDASDLPLSATVILDAPYALDNQCGETRFDGENGDCLYVAGSGAVKCK